MTKGQEKSDDRVVPEGRRKAIPTAARRGGKVITASEEVGQLELFRETADSSQEPGEGDEAGRPAPAASAGPKSRTTTAAIPLAMTAERSTFRTSRAAVGAKALAGASSRACHRSGPAQVDME